jgi:hypothetical protein
MRRTPVNFGAYDKSIEAAIDRVNRHSYRTVIENQDDCVTLANMIGIDVRYRSWSCR